MRIPIMKCRHNGYGLTKDNKPICHICDCEELAEVKPNLKGRFAKCWCCHGNIKPSSYSLPFFEMKEKFNKNAEYDSYYCGCGGWD